MTGPEIVRVEAIPLEAPLDEPFAYSQAWVDTREALLVRIETEDGIIGWGESWGPIAGTRETIEEFFRPLLVGRTIHDVPSIYEKLYDAGRAAYQSIVPLPAIAGIDIALWDIVAKDREVSVATALGEKHRSVVPAYATGHYFKPVDSIEEQFDRIATEAAENMDALGAIKLKLGLSFLDYDWQTDVALVRRVREQVGESGTIMVDANYAYDLDTATQVGTALDQYDIRWFEEPLRPEDENGFRTLCSKLSIPIATGECLDPAGMMRYLEGELLDIAQPDVCNIGGLTPASEIATAVESIDSVQFIPHVWGTPIALGASLQLLATVKSDTMLEFDRSPNPLREQLATEPITPDSEGKLKIPDGPGLGIELDESSIEQYRCD